MTSADCGLTQSQGAKRDRSLIDSPVTPLQFGSLFPFFCLAASPSKNPLLKQIQFVTGQSFSKGAEEAVIMGCVVDHEQDSGQQLVGHQQVVQVCPLVVPTAVTATPLH